MWSSFLRSPLKYQKFSTVLANRAYCQSFKLLVYGRALTKLSTFRHCDFVLGFQSEKKFHSLTMSVPAEIQAKIDAVENVDIDPDGRIKYVLIKLYHPDHEENFKYITRGYSWAEWHGKGFCEIFKVFAFFGVHAIRS